MHMRFLRPPRRAAAPPNANLTRRYASSARLAALVERIPVVTPELPAWKRESLELRERRAGSPSPTEPGPLTIARNRRALHSCRARSASAVAAAAAALGRGPRLPNPPPLPVPRLPLHGRQPCANPRPTLGCRLAAHLSKVYPEQLTVAQEGPDRRQARVRPADFFFFVHRSHGPTGGRRGCARRQSSSPRARARGRGTGRGMRRPSTASWLTGSTSCCARAALGGCLRCERGGPRATRLAWGLTTPLLLLPPPLPPPPPASTSMRSHCAARADCRGLSGPTSRVGHGRPGAPEAGGPFHFGHRP